MKKEIKNNGEVIVYNIRKLEEKDVLQVNNIYISGFNREPNEDYFSIVKDKNYLCFVAEYENNLVGYINLLVVDSVAEIINVSVLDDFRKKGVGTQLIDFSIKYLIENQFTGVMLEVNENNLPAINLYKKIGFKEVYVRRKYYEGKYDAIIMKLDF